MPDPPAPAGLPPSMESLHSSQLPHLSEQPLPAAHSAAQTQHNRPHVAHHVAEFGEVGNLVHLADTKRHSDTVPAPPVSQRDALARRERWTRLRDRLFAERHLMQYFHAETLYRTEGTRSIGPDELFLDLVIVGGIAALGHELREAFSGWSDVEKFFLLFNAVYSGWTSLVMLWNLWDMRSDLVDKFGIYVAFFSLTGIALGAHGAFVDGPRPYVAVCAFTATALPRAHNLLWSWREPLLKNPQNIVNQLVLMSGVHILIVVPYLAAAFVDSERTARNLFWVPVALQMISTFVTGSAYRLLHRNRSGFSRLAIAIELMVEKYEVLTMIVLGESVLGLLFEAALVITLDGARIGHLYAGACAATVMLYSLQTLYVNVDGRIIKGGVHAIRHKGIYGIIWGQLHLWYHFLLILFATGLGIAVRDITIRPEAAPEGAVERMAGLLVRAGAAAEETSGATRFTRDARWLFSAGWGGSILLSGAIGSLHFSGPRVATKWCRLIIRALLTIGVMIGMPFTDVSADSYVYIHAGVLVFIAVVEFLFHEMDSMGFFRSEFTTPTSSSVGGQNAESFDADDSEDLNKVKEEVAKVCDQSTGPTIARALEQRLRRRHHNRLVPVKSAPPEKDNTGEEHEGNEGA